MTRLARLERAIEDFLASRRKRFRRALHLCHDCGHQYPAAWWEQKVCPVCNLQKELDHG